MVIITGLGRCGTSILIKYLKEVGILIGKQVYWHDEVRAGYELAPFYSLVHDLYHRFCKVDKPIDLDVECLGDYWKGRTYRQAFREFDRDERQGKIQVVKDPRITWHPDIIQAIYEARGKNFNLIICHRRIEDIMGSRKSLPEQYDDPKPRKYLIDYQIDFAEFYTRVLELEINYTVMFFPNFLKKFNTMYRKLIEIGLSHDFNIGYKVWGNLIDKELLK